MLPTIIIENLKNQSIYYKETNSQLVIKCPFCGDSEKTNHVHLYINKEISKTFGYSYHCFKCDESGSLLKLLSHLNILHILDKDSLIEISKKYNEQNNFDTYSHYYFNNKVVYNNPKLEYVKSRLKNINKVLLNLLVTDFSNIPDRFFNNAFQKDILQKNYIGFLTMNKNKIICRRINNNQNFQRYFVLKLNDVEDFFVYVEDLNNLKLLQKNKIIFGEGIFTVLNGYRQLKDKFNFDETSILVAGLGKNYIQAINFIFYNFGVPDWDIFILADQDVDYKKIISLFQKNNLYNVKILYNKDSNDFGEDSNSYNLIKI